MKPYFTTIILISVLLAPYWRQGEDWSWRCGKWVYHASAFVDTHSTYTNIANKGLLESNPFISLLMPPSDPAPGKRVAVALATTWLISQGLDKLHRKFEHHRILKPLIEGLQIGISTRHFITAFKNYGR